MRMTTLVLAMLAIATVLPASASAVRVCSTGTIAQCTPGTEFLPLSPPDPGPIPGHEACVSYNGQEACAGYTVGGGLVEAPPPQSQQLYLCWTSVAFACRTWTLVGTHELCVRWDDMNPSCFQVEG